MKITHRYSQKNKHCPGPAQPAAVVPATVIGLETEAGVAAAIEKAVEVTADDLLAIRRLRNSLIEKLFAPDRTFNSWTELKATN